MKGGYKMSLKKAQGEIITTVLIILLVLAAIVIVWQVVQSSVSRGGEQAKGQTSCIGMNYVILNYQIIIKYLPIQPEQYK